MLLRTCRLTRVISEELRTISHLVSSTNHVSKRYAGHSQYANRKSAKEASSERRGQLIKKYQWEINKEVRLSKNANPATNSKLQAILGEAMKNNVPKTSLDNALKVAAASLGRDCINLYVFSNPIGIVSLIEVSSIQREHAKYQTTGIVKKFGFQFVNNGESTINIVGIITCKPLENVNDPLDKAVEDAIVANCEEVRKTDMDLIEFQCHPQQIDSCTKHLTDLGYTIENSETKYIFPELVQIDDEVIMDKLDKMEEKLEQLPGFVRIVYNID